MCWGAPPSGAATPTEAAAGAAAQPTSAEHASPGEDDAAAARPAPLPADADSRLSQASAALREGDLDLAQALLAPLLSVDTPSPQGAQALYLAANLARRRSDTAAAQAMLLRLSQEAWASLLPARLAAVARGWLAEGDADPSGLAAALREASALPWPQKRAPMEAWLAQAPEGSPERGRAVAALAEMSLEHGDHPGALAAAQEALPLLQAAGADEMAVSGMEIVRDRAALELRRGAGARWASAAVGAALLAALALRPWRRWRPGDGRRLASLALNGAFAAALLSGLYALGASADGGSQPLRGPQLLILAAVVALAAATSAALTVGLRGRGPWRITAAAAGVAGAVTTAASVYLFAWAADYLAAFGL